jgi:hypothetical protein
MEADMTHPLIATVESRFGGVLTKGSHAPDGHACLLEAVSIARGLDWTDDPSIVRMPDLRGLNDAPWSSDEVRTMHLLPVGVALYDWAEWPEERRQEFAKRVAEQTIRVIVPMALRQAAKANPKFAADLEAAAKLCADEGTESAAAWSASASAAAAAARSAAASAARSAAWWAAESAARSAAWWAAESAAAARSAAASAAESAAESAESAARSAAWWAAESAARSDEPLIAICHIFIEAAEG